MTTPGLDLNAFAPRRDSQDEDAFSAVEERSATATDTLDDFFRRYTVQISPSVRIKFKKRLRSFRLGAHLAIANPTEPSISTQSWEFTVRPPKGSQRLLSNVLSKVTLRPDRQQLLWRTSKINLLKFFRVKVQAGYDWGLRSGTLHWNVTTKWNADERKAAAKARIALSRRAELVPHFRAAYSLPSMEGGVGGIDEAANIDEGYCHASMPSIDLQLCLDRHPEPLQPVWQHLPLLRRLYKQTKPEEEPGPAPCQCQPEALPQRAVRQMQEALSRLRLPHFQPPPGQLPSPSGLPSLPFGKHFARPQSS